MKNIKSVCILCPKTISFKLKHARPYQLICSKCDDEYYMNHEYMNQEDFIQAKQLKSQGI